MADDHLFSNFTPDSVRIIVSPLSPVDWRYCDGHTSVAPGLAPGWWRSYDCEVTKAGPEAQISRLGTKHTDNSSSSITISHTIPPTPNTSPPTSGWRDKEGFSHSLQTNNVGGTGLAWLVTLSEIWTSPAQRSVHCQEPPGINLLCRKEAVFTESWDFQSTVI